MALPVISIVVHPKQSALKFLIMDSPNDINIAHYVTELKEREVRDVVRVCKEQNYEKSTLEKEGITVHELPFADGTCPDSESIVMWLALVKATQAAKNAGTLSMDAALAVHCVAGLGRAPLMVGIALVDAGMAHTDAVSLIRKVRRGALNIKQLEYLASYVPKGGKSGECCVMS